MEKVDLPWNLWTIGTLFNTLFCGKNPCYIEDLSTDPHHMYILDANKTLNIYKTGLHILLSTCT